MVSALGTDILTFNPCMPNEVEKISFQIIWKGQKIKVTVTKDAVTVINLSDKEIVFKVHDKKASATPNAEVTVAY